MTIAAALAVPDGIALAADTQITWYSTITTAKQKGTDQTIELAQPIQVPIGWSRMARKLFSVQMEERISPSRYLARRFSTTRLPTPSLSLLRRDTRKVRHMTRSSPIWSMG